MTQLNQDSIVRHPDLQDNATVTHTMANSTQFAQRRQAQIPRHPELSEVEVELQWKICFTLF